MRLLTWNIRQGGRGRVPAIAAAIAEAAPDVLVLTEFVPSDPDDVREHLSSIGLTGQLVTEPPSRDRGILIAARSHLSVGDADGCPTPWRWLHARAPELGLDVYGSYIPTAQGNALGKAAYWDWLLERAESLASRDSILLGDLNTGLHRLDENGATFRCADQMTSFIDIHWIDAYRELHPTGTDRSWWSPAGNGFRLDHAFVPRRLRDHVTGARYSDTFDDTCIVQRPDHVNCKTPPASDHAMLIIDLELGVHS